MLVPRSIDQKGGSCRTISEDFQFRVSGSQNNQKCTDLLKIAFKKHNKTWPTHLYQCVGHVFD